MTPRNQRPISAVADEVEEVYYSLMRTVRTREADGETPLLDRAAGDEVSSSLSLPIELWTAGLKPTRTVPALVAYDVHVDRELFDDLSRVLVGLDVLVAMLDEFIDSKQTERRYRTDLAINIAFASLLSFGSVPESKRDAVNDAILDFLVETAQIPRIEHAVYQELTAADSPESAMDLVLSAYRYRARDISVFGRIPAIIYDVDERTARRIERDLQTYRAHYLLFDDLRDVREDRRNDTQTPVTWLVSVCDGPDEVAQYLEAVYEEFEYSEAAYTEQLRESEDEPGTLDELIASEIRLHRSRTVSQTG